MESPHGKATEHECARGKVDVVWLRPRPEDGSRRCRMGSAASMGPKYHAEPRRSPRGMPVTHLSPLGTLRRAVTRPASMADVHPPRTQRLCVHIPPPLSERMEATPFPGLLRFVLVESFHWDANQRTGAGRHAEWRCGCRRWLAPVADLPRSTTQKPRFRTGR